MYFSLSKKMPNFLPRLLIFYKYIVFINHKNWADWAAAMKAGPLIWACSTGLSLLIIKALVSTQVHCFGNKSEFKSDCFLANPDPWTITFPQSFFLYFQWMPPWNFVDQLQSQRPMVYSIYFVRLKSTMILCVLYCVSIYCMALELLNTKPTVSCSWWLLFNFG